MYGFCPKNVWTMGYGAVMDYGTDLCGNQCGNSENLWDIGGYGLSVWVKREATVLSVPVSATFRVDLWSYAKVRRRHIIRERITGQVALTWSPRAVIQSIYGATGLVATYVVQAPIWSGTKFSSTRPEVPRPKLSDRNVKLTIFSSFDTGTCMG